MPSKKSSRKKHAKKKMSVETVVDSDDDRKMPARQEGSSNINNNDFVSNNDNDQGRPRMFCDRKLMDKLVEHPNKMNAKRLIQALPELPGMLKNDSSEENLKTAFDAVQQEMWMSEPFIKSLFDAGVYKDFDVTLFEEMAMHAAPGDTFDQQKLRKLLAGKMNILLIYTANHERSKYEEERIDFASALTHSQAMENFQYAFDKAITPLKQKIVKTCFHGSQVAFHQHCTAYQADQETFSQFFCYLLHKFLQKSFHKDDAWKKPKDQIMEPVRHAFLDVARGNHESVNICWTCGKKGTKACPNCDVAMYCGRECQVKQYHKFHKRVCKCTKQSFALYEEARATVDHAFQEEEVVPSESNSSIKPSSEDYLIANQGMRCASNAVTITAMLARPGATATTNPTAAAFGPSMTNFYHNLELLVDHGVWWYHQVAKDLNIERPSWRRRRTSNNTTTTKEEEEKQQKVTFYAIAYAMMFDYSFLNNNNHKRKYFQLRIEDYCYINNDPWIQTKILCWMTPQEWLNRRCATDSTSKDEDCSWQAQSKRRFFKVDFIRYLREKQNTELTANLISLLG